MVLVYDVCTLPINDFRLIELVTDIGGFEKLGLDYRFYVHQYRYNQGSGNFRIIELCQLQATMAS